MALVLLESNNQFQLVNDLGSRKEEVFVPYFEYKQDCPEGLFSVRILMPYQSRGAKTTSATLYVDYDKNTARNIAHDFALNQARSLATLSGLELIDKFEEDLKEKAERALRRARDAPGAAQIDLDTFDFPRGR